MREAGRVLDRVNDRYSLGLKMETHLIGGAAIDATGEPLPAETLVEAKQSEAVILGAVGGPKWDSLSMDKRPEKGLLKIRAGMDLFANLRPALLSGISVRIDTQRGCREWIGLIDRPRADWGNLLR